MTLSCPFCALPETRIIRREAHALVVPDAHPVSPGHTLIVPVRHVASFFETTPDERAALLEALDWARREVLSRLSPDGFNIGINDGAAAGQTIMHLHLHLIPRYVGDWPDPRGGVRWLFPDKAPYWDKS
jgi:diadenosine tetraphosphate (Ap4A) HIT family hydrolase